MKNRITRLIAGALLFFAGAAFAAGEAEPEQPSAIAPEPAASAVPATAPEAPAAVPATPRPAAKQAASRKTAIPKPRPKNLDLRYCLELESNAAIAKCAGE
jgi:hypothetical protein